MRQELERQAHMDISTCQLPTLWSVHQTPAGQPNWIAIETSLLRVLTLDRSRTHLGSGKDAPERRGIMRQGEIIGIPQVGGLHHRYERRVA